MKTVLARQINVLFVHRFIRRHLQEEWPKISGPLWERQVLPRVAFLPMSDARIGGFSQVQFVLKSINVEN